ncbi:hypothetical protein ACTI_16040 [Actinoplanes sp. OR16]|nr:hypothetical protein ACTI_16040 [Actinoplanes sp. OR16]
MLRVGHTRHREVDDGLSAEFGDGLGGRARVGPDVFHPVQQVTQTRWRVVGVQADDTIDPWISGETSGHPSAEITADSGDHDNAGR